MKKIIFILMSVSIFIYSGCSNNNDSVIKYQDGSSNTGSILLNVSTNQFAATKSVSDQNNVAQNSPISKNIIPTIDMNPASYELTLKGPNGESLVKTINEGTTLVKNLPFGEWVITINVKNINNVLIAMGQKTATVYVNETVNVDITARPLDGFGKFLLSLQWNGAQTQTPSITAELLPQTGSTYNLNIPVSNGNTGNYDSSQDTVNFPQGIPTGYYTLIVKLYDGIGSNRICVMGAVDVVRIVKDQTSSGTMVFNEINQGSGGIQVNINTQMGEPLTVTLTGQAAELHEGDSMAVTASVDSSVPSYNGNLIYVWYINGNSIGTGKTFTFGNNLQMGVYRLDVTAFTVDGTRAGSISYNFHVIEKAVPSTWEIILSQANEMVKCIIQTSDNGFMAVGTSGYTTDIFLKKLDENGNIQWQKTLAIPDFQDANSVVQTDDGGYVIVGRNYIYTGSSTNTSVYVVKLNSQGQLVWEKSFFFEPSSTLNVGNSIIETNEKDLLIGGQAYNDGLLMKLNSEGNIIWQVRNNYWGAIWSLVKIDNNNYVACGDIRILKFDSSGNVLITKPIIIENIYNLHSKSMKKTNDGGFVVLGHGQPNLPYHIPFVIKLDQNLNNVWVKLYDINNSKNSIGNAIVQKGDGGYIFGGYGINATNINVSNLFSTDINGNLIWKKIYEGIESNFINDVSNTKDGNYIFAAARGNNSTFWVKKFNNNEGN